jgi:hypothetical protein
MESGRGWHTCFCTQDFFPFLGFCEQELINNIHIIDGTIRRRDCHLRNRQLQNFIAKLGE